LIADIAIMYIICKKLRVAKNVLVTIDFNIIVSHKITIEPNFVIFPAF